MIFFDGEQIFPDQANNFKIFLMSKMANTYQKKNLLFMMLKMINF